MGSGFGAVVLIREEAIKKKKRKKRNKVKETVEG